MLVRWALAALFLAMFVAGVHPVIGEGGAAYRIPMLIVGLVGLGVTVGRWWALAFAFVPVLLVVVGVGYGPDVTDEGVPIFIVLGPLVFAPAMALASPPASSLDVSESTIQRPRIRRLNTPHLTRKE